MYAILKRYCRQGNRRSFDSDEFMPKESAKKARKCHYAGTLQEWVVTDCSPDYIGNFSNMVVKRVNTHSGVSCYSLN
jgi:hypothetical protein